MPATKLSACERVVLEDTAAEIMPPVCELSTCESLAAIALQARGLVRIEARQGAHYLRLSATGEAFILAALDAARAARTAQAARQPAL